MLSATSLAMVAAKVENIVTEVGAVGDMSRLVMRRYENMFSTFRGELTEALAAASSMEEAAEIANSLVDTVAEALRKSFPGVADVDCRAGCGACCNLFVAVPPGSAALIADHIRDRWDGNERRALRDRLSAAAAALESVGNPVHARVRCPLLGDDERCMVYEVRPLACRAFTSKSVARCHGVIFGSDPRAEETIDQNPAHYRLHEEATRALEEEARSRGMDARQRGLVHALLGDPRLGDMD